MGSQTNNNNNNNSNNGNGKTPLPNATSETLVLTRATDNEKSRTWTFNYREWGGALSLDQYLQREPYVTTIPLARDGGMAHWILTTKPPSGEEETTSTTRPVLASCESIRKRMLVARPPQGSSGGEREEEEEKDVQISEAVGYGIGSVYTYPEFRGRSYAKRMLKELGTALKTWPLGEGEQQQQLEKHGEDVTNGGKAEPKKGEEKQQQHAICSALWSDIGKVFYAQKGWHPFPSVHVSFPASSASASSNSSSSSSSNNPQKIPLEPITYANLASFTSHDEALLRQRLARIAARTRKTAFAFAPDYDALRWHLYRDGFIASFIHEGTPVPPTSPLGEEREKALEIGAATATAAAEEVVKVAAGDMPTKGIVATCARHRPGRRIWAIWARNYQASPEVDPAKNTLYILRLVVEGVDEDIDGEKGEGEGEEGEQELTEALASVLDAARAEAARWGCARVDLWNPTPLVRRLLEQIGDGEEALPRRWVERDTDSIPSLMWYGDEDEGDVEWVANEKYCWC